MVFLVSHNSSPSLFFIFLLPTMPFTPPGRFIVRVVHQKRVIDTLWASQRANYQQASSLANVTIRFFTIDSYFITTEPRSGHGEKKILQYLFQGHVLLHRALEMLLRAHETQFVRTFWLIHYHLLINSCALDKCIYTKSRPFSTKAGSEQHLPAFLLTKANVLNMPL